MQSKRDHVNSLIFSTGERVKIVIENGDWHIINLPQSFTKFAEEHLKPEETLSDYVHLALLNHALAILKKEKGGKTTPIRKQKHESTTT